MRRSVLGLLFGITVFFLLPGHCAADTVIFSNINNSPNPVCCGYAVGTYPGTSNVFIDTFPFTVQGGSFTLTTVGFLESQSSTGTSDGFTLYLYADSAGAPGTVLESWQGIPATAQIALGTASSTGNITLFSGQQYWFGVTTTDPLQTGVWWINPGLVEGTGCDFLNGVLIPCDSTLAVGAFEISGTPVPEPSSLFLLGAGLLALGPLIRVRLGRL
jgi:PEP-CTERM motif